MTTTYLVPAAGRTHILWNPADPNYVVYCPAHGNAGSAHDITTRAGINFLDAEELTHLNTQHPGDTP